MQSKINPKLVLTKTKPKVYMIWLVILILFDQSTKIWIINNYALYEGQVISDFFSIWHIHNKGAAFGFLNEESGWQVYFLSIIAFLVSSTLIFYILNVKNIMRLELLALTMISAGAIGNMIDRIRDGYVIDFLDFHYMHYHFPTFNLADSFIFIGVILFLFSFFNKPKMTNA